MQFGIEHNFDEFIEIKSGVLRLDERNIESHDDKLVLSWSEENMVSVDKEEVLFTLVFNKVKSDPAGEMYINEDRLRAEAYQEENYNILSIELEERLALYTKNTLLQNEPNPFIDRTMIKFYLMDASDATLSIYDVNGRLLKKISGYFDEGLNAIEVDAKSLGIDGLLYYQVESKDWTDSKKMILIKQ